MNIYKALGASPANFLDDYSPTRIAVYGDGSCNDATKKWAMERLGFDFDGEVKLCSWCEAGDKSNLCPAAFDFMGFRMYGSPIPGRPGYFCLEYAAIQHQPYYMPPVRPDGLKAAFTQGIEESRRLFTELSGQKNIVSTSDLSADTQFEWDGQAVKWLYRGIPTNDLATKFSAYPEGVSEKTVFFILETP